MPGQCLVGLPVVLAGEEDHRRIALLAQTAQQFVAIHARHLDVAYRKIQRFLSSAFSAAAPW